MGTLHVRQDWTQNASDQHERAEGEEGAAKNPRQNRHIFFWPTLTNFFINVGLPEGVVVVERLDPGRRARVHGLAPDGEDPRGPAQHAGELRLGVPLPEQPADLIPCLTGLHAAPRG